MISSVRLVLIALSLLLGWAGVAQAQSPNQVNRNPNCVIANLPACYGANEPGRTVLVVDGQDPDDCTVGGGSDVHLCLLTAAGSVSIGAAGTAPGMIGNMLTMETLQWLWSRERIPFPEKVPGEWTNYYFSYDNSGVMPQGDNANSGLDPGSPKRSVTGVGGAIDTCFTDNVRPHCWFDGPDDWSDTGGFGAGFGRLTPALMNTADCGKTTSLESLRAPCFWLSSMPGSRTHFDASGTATNVSCAAFEAIVYNTTLIEAIDLTCDTAVDGNEAVWDVQEASGVVVVGGDMTSHSSGNSAQVASSHDIGFVQVYGNSQLAFGIAPTLSGSIIGQNGAGSVTLHSQKTIFIPEPTPITLGHKVISMAQSGGGTDPTLIADVLATPASVLVTGATLMNADTTTSSGSQIIDLQPGCTDGTGTPSCVDGVENSDHVIFTMIGTKSLNRSDYAAPVTLTLTHGTGDLDIGTSRWEVNIFQSVFADDGQINQRWLDQGSFADPDPGARLNMRLWNVVFEPSGAGHQIFRMLATQFAVADNPLSSILADDIIYNSQSDQWRINTSLGVCQDPTATDLSACADQTLFVMGVGDTSTITLAQTVGEGYCDTVAPRECAGAVVGTSDKGTVFFPVRNRCAPYMCGKWGNGFVGQPTIYDNIGRGL